MRVVPAAQRLTKLNFIATNDCTTRDWPKYPPTLFTCGHCEFTVELVMADFMRHEDTDFTNLTSHNSEEITVFVENNIEHIHRKYGHFTSFLDFYCPQCQNPTRLYYYGDWRAASRRAVYGYDLLFVVE